MEALVGFDEPISRLTTTLVELQMAAAQHTSQGPDVPQPLPWFSVNIAEFFLSPGVAAIYGNNDLLATMMRFAMHSWRAGPVTRKEATEMLGSDISQLVERGVLTVSPGDFLTLPWLEKARIGAESYRQQRADAAKARWASRTGVKDAVAMRSHTDRNAAGMLVQYSTEQREEKDQSETQKPSLVKTSSSRREKKSAPRAEPTGPHAEVISYHGAKYRAVFGASYDFQGGADGKAVAHMLKVAGGNAELVKQRIDRACVDPWCLKAGLKLTVIRGAWNSLVKPVAPLAVSSASESPLDAWKRKQADEQAALTRRNAGGAS